MKINCNTNSEYVFIGDFIFGNNILQNIIQFFFQDLLFSSYYFHLYIFCQIIKRKSFIFPFSEAWRLNCTFLKSFQLTQSNLQIQCNPYQATNSIFHRTRTNNFTICMEIQKTSSSQSNLEKEEWNWRNQPA